MDTNTEPAQTDVRLDAANIIDERAKECRSLEVRSRLLRIASDLLEPAIFDEKRPHKIISVK